jgi:hypothetical protein
MAGGRSCAILAIVLHDDIFEFRFHHIDILDRERAQGFQERSQEAFHFEGPQARRGLDDSARCTRTQREARWRISSTARSSTSSPLRSKATRSQMRSTSESTCDDMKTVAPRRLVSAISV